MQAQRQVRRELIKHVQQAQQIWAAGNAHDNCVCGFDQLVALNWRVALQVLRSSGDYAVGTGEAEGRTADSQARADWRTADWRSRRIGEPRISRRE